MKKKTVVWMHVIGISLLFWFLGVDRSWFIESCDDCHYERDLSQYRVFSVVIHERIREHHTKIELVARDLGVSCSHPYIGLSRFHKHRWWGLCILGRPNINGTWRLSASESWYTEELATEVKNLGRDDPGLGEEFRRRVVRGHDRNYWGRFVRELRDNKIEQIVLRAGSLSDHELQEIADRIEHVEWLVLERRYSYRQPQPDESAEAILALGERMGPYLVEKIVDENPSRWLSWASLGDIAHVLLSAIYESRWPASGFVKEHELGWNESYLSYHRKFLRSENSEQNRGNREKLRDAWRERIAENRK